LIIRGTVMILNAPTTAVWARLEGGGVVLSLFYGPNKTSLITCWYTRFPVHDAGSVGSSKMAPTKPR